MDDLLHMVGKVKLSGNTVEIKEYRVPIACGQHPLPSIKEDKPKRGEEGEKRYDNLYRARATIREIIWANESPYTKFVTLTYAKTCLDVKKVRNDVASFLKAMRRMGYDMKYLYVLEHQKERGKKEGNAGSLHVHMVLFLDVKVDLDDLRKAWPHCPHPDIKKTRKIRNLGAYVCKYITKENFADFGKRVYSVSLGLDRPVEERFYKEGCSDRTIGFSLDQYKEKVNVTYVAERSSDFRAPDGNIVWQHTTVTKGTVEYDPLLDPIWESGDVYDLV